MRPARQRAFCRCIRVSTRRKRRHPYCATSRSGSAGTASRSNCGTIAGERVGRSPRRQGQSASTATTVKPCFSIRQRVIAALASSPDDSPPRRPAQKRSAPASSSGWAGRTSKFLRTDRARQRLHFRAVLCGELDASPQRDRKSPDTSRSRRQKACASPSLSSKLDTRSAIKRRTDKARDASRGISFVNAMRAT